MNSGLWVLQIVLAVAFGLAGSMKVVVRREQLARRMHWANDWPRSRIKLLGLAEVAGAVGVVAPMATGLAPVLTPLAAVCLAVLMVGAVRTHQRLRESVAPAGILGALCVFVAVGRFAGAA